MILAISGSLRHDSRNSAVLRAAAQAAARDDVEVVVGDWVRRLPHFDPDLEAAPPAVVGEFRSACGQAAAVLLAVPEYAFGIPGAFKNALDWTVGSGSLYRKPVALLSVAPPGRGAQVRQALDAVFTAIDCDVAHYAVPVAVSDRGRDGEITDPHVVEALQAVVVELSERARKGSAEAQMPLRGLRHT
jgi:chromate reductase, NAD(P)H dehydrogenase (quinone)